MLHRVIVAIPAFNAVKTLSALIDSLERLYPHIDIVVVDDGSIDGTGEATLVHGAALVTHAHNLGKGAALRSAFAFALERDYDAVLTMDADLQHDPEEVQHFLEEFVDDQTVLLGLRQLSPDMPLERKVSNSLSTFMTSVFAGRRIVDSQCGFRLIPTAILRRLRLVSSHYDLEPELIIRAARAGYRIHGIPISTIYNDSESSISPFRDTLRFLNMLFKSLLW